MSKQTIQQVDSTANQVKDQIRDSVVEVFSGEIFLLIGAILAFVIRQKWQTFFKIRTIAKELLSEKGFQERLRQKLSAVLEVSGADRVLVVKFSFYQNLLQNYTETRCSLTHQFVKENITVMDSFKDLYVSQLYREIVDLRDQNLKWITKEEALPGCAGYMEKIQVTTYAAMMVCSDLGLPLAILGLHYCNNRKPEPQQVKNTEELFVKIKKLIQEKT